jgi:imidazolonepropionase-like amidohydrolase
MKRLFSLAIAFVFILPAIAAAQDVAITNARIIVGSGQVIDSGTIIVKGWKIVSVTAGAAPTQGLRTIDAKGMSAMPGFIDSHKHVSNGENAAGQARLLLEAGYTDRALPVADRPTRTSRCATGSTRASSSARASSPPVRSISGKRRPKPAQRSRRWRRRASSTPAKSR